MTKGAVFVDGGGSAVDALLDDLAAGLAKLPPEEQQRVLTAGERLAASRRRAAANSAAARRREDFLLALAISLGVIVVRLCLWVVMG